MPLLVPNQSALSDAFSPRLPFSRHTSTATPQSYYSSSEHIKQHRYPAWSQIEDLRSKAGTLSEEAQQELKKSSQAIQAKTGKIELYSAKYYATCTLGGLLACVGRPAASHPPQSLTDETGPYPHRRDAVGPSEMSTTGGFQDVQGEFGGLAQNCPCGRGTGHLYWMESNPFWILGEQSRYRPRVFWNLNILGPRCFQVRRL